MKRTVALAGAAAAAWFGPGAAAHAPALATALGIRRRGDGPGVALTFDDGPHPQGTPAVLDTLAARGAHATFFLVGEQVERRPALAAEIVARGHAVALHGYRHRNQMRVPPRALRDDLRRGVAAIAEATGRVPVLERAPYGIFTPAGLALARRAGRVPLLWSKWGRDWNTRLTPAQIAAMAVRAVAPGDIVLLHDADFYSDDGSWRNTTAALRRILDELGRGQLGTVPA